MNKKQISCKELYKKWLKLYKTRKGLSRNASGSTRAYSYFPASDSLREKELKLKLKAGCMQELDLSPAERHEINKK